MRSTLLLVDDDENVLRALQRVLRRDGYDIHIASSAAQAMAILTSHPIHVVLSDQRMPEENGSELLSKVKDLYPHTVRLMLSGYTELASVTEAINQGAIYKFLTKPWDDEQLRANLREAFARYQMEMQNVMLKEEVESVNAELMVLNHVLEQRIEDRNERIQRDQSYSQVLLEMFNHLPVGLIGVDSAGDVVVLNTQAYRLLGAAAGTLIGEPYTALPPPLAGAVEQVVWGGQSENSHALVDVANETLRLEVHIMGAESASSGCLLLLNPTEEVAY